ncbi:Type 1 glutamine amidotransferase-like domain-containing protein [Erysipelothrix anatis]|uniref:Type 1 glutamine amidotransferase-like domain-containing protein n=1 Tax=Erysipelothrix anatis TaxID=2683713 RepID=UPI00140C68BA|nr:Type 1 glutamine amidotransferase-like domain-containing protein [Erysipelothrix anatis]
MSVHYYLDWYYDTMPSHIQKSLQQTILHRETIALISGDPLYYEGENPPLAEREWLLQAGIEFKNYVFVDNKLSTEEARRAVSQASVVFILGGYNLEQKKMIDDLELDDVIRNHEGIIIGTSAGAINMSEKWVCSPRNKYDVKEASLQEGLRLNKLSFEPHFDLENHDYLDMDLMPFSYELPIYAPTKNGAIKVVNGIVEVLGDVYLLSNGQIQRIK